MKSRVGDLQAKHLAGEDTDILSKGLDLRSLRIYFSAGFDAFTSPPKV
jgi:hypothetical protein